MTALRDFKDLTHNARYEHHLASQVDVSAGVLCFAYFQCFMPAFVALRMPTEDKEGPRPLYVFYTKFPPFGGALDPVRGLGIGEHGSSGGGEPRGCKLIRVCLDPGRFTRHT